MKMCQPERNYLPMYGGEIIDSIEEQNIRTKESTQRLPLVECSDAIIRNSEDRSI